MELGPGHVDEWTQSLAGERHLAASTIRSYQTELRLFSDWATKAPRRGRSPAASVAVGWQRAPAGDWAAYAADFGRRAGQIAAAAEVSESTLFRYFPAKEDVITWDPFDPQLIGAFRGQPAALTPIAALRAAFTQVMTRLSAAEWAEQRERVQLLLRVPPLRARLMDHGVRQPMRLIAGAVAERTGRKPSDPAVRALAGAVIGVGLAAMFAWAEDPDADIISLFDELMAQLEAGLPPA